MAIPKNRKNHLDSFSDKVLHCLARLIQDLNRGKRDGCLYCKYAEECSREFKKEGLLRIELERELACKTSVFVSMAAGDGKEERLLEGSWIERYPELLKQFQQIPYKKQREILVSGEFETMLSANKEKERSE